MQQFQDKLHYVVEEAHARIDATLTAYDSICSKATALLSIAMPLIAGLGAYCIIHFDLGSPRFYAAAVYALMLAISTVPLWKIVTGVKLAHNGRPPSDYLDVGEFKTLSLSEIWLKFCHFYEADITNNEDKVERSARLLRNALSLFAGATLSSLAVLAIGSTIQFFAWHECGRLAPSPPVPFEKHLQPPC